MSYFFVLFLFMKQSFKQIHCICVLILVNTNKIDPHVYHAYQSECFIFISSGRYKILLLYHIHARAVMLCNLEFNGMNPELEFFGFYRKNEHHL